MRRLPTLPIFFRLVLTSILVWAMPRALLTSGARSMAARYDISPSLSPVTLFLLALGVSWVVLLDLTISRERIFAQNLGTAPLTIMGLALGTVALCEITLASLPVLLALFGGG